MVDVASRERRMLTREVEFARYPGGSHAMLRVGPPSHRADLLERVLAWFTGHLMS